MALSDGRVAKAGGRVVKNVAGYDLSRLVCGSFGSLAVITSATFKLAPLPAASRTIVATCKDAQHAARLALAVAAEPVTPSAVEIGAPGSQLLIRFETTERAVDQMAVATRAILSAGGASSDLLVDEAECEIWRKHERLIWNGPGLIAKICVLPTDIESVLGMLGRLDRQNDWSVVGRAALGVLLVRVNANDANPNVTLSQLRGHVADKRGTLVMLRGSPDLESPRAGPHDVSSMLMDRVKTRFDPTRGL